MFDDVFHRDVSSLYLGQRRRQFVVEYPECFPSPQHLLKLVDGLDGAPPVLQALEKGAVLVFC